MATHIMVDLETMGNGSNAAIVSIGAVQFSGVDGISSPFYAKVDLESCAAAGLTIDASTVLWWMAQSEEARAEITRKDNMPLSTALYSFSKYIEGLGESSDICIWGNGATFDNVILRNAYKAVHLEAPWAFWNDRCYRTLKAMRKSVVLPVRGGVHHNALDDAKYQAECAILMLKGDSK